MATFQANSSRIFSLPNEILEMIIEQIDDIPSLHALVSVDFQAKLLFQARPQATMVRTITNSSMPRQFQQILCAILSHSHHVNHMDREWLHIYRSKSSLFGSLKSNLVADLENVAAELFLDLGPSLSPGEAMATLTHATHICFSIFMAEYSFINTTLPMTVAKIQRNTRTNLSYQNPSTIPPNNPSAPPSATELYRIRRALWRLWLYFEIFHNPVAKAHPEYDNSTTIWTTQLFFSTMTRWEIDELSCVYHHIRHQSHLWRLQCPQCPNRHMPDDDTLVNHTRPHNHISTPSLPAALIYIQQNLHTRDASSPPAQWPDCPLPATASNSVTPFILGYDDFVAAHRSAFLLLWRPDPNSCLAWGYCMWDIARFQGCFLVDRPWFWDGGMLL